MMNAPLKSEIRDPKSETISSVEHALPAVREKMGAGEAPLIKSAPSAFTLTPCLPATANGGESSEASAGAPVSTTDGSPTDAARAGDVRSAGPVGCHQEDHLAALMESPLPGENTAPSFIVSSVLETRNSEPETRNTSSVLVALPGLESPEAKRLKKRNQRQDILKTFDQLTGPVKDGGLAMSHAAAAKHMGVSIASLWRLRKTREEKGVEGLLPKTANSGRKSPFRDVLLNEAFCEKLKLILLSTMGSSGGNMEARAARTGRSTFKVATALMLMAEEPECPPLLGHKLRHQKFPLDLVRFCKRVTPELESRLRGPKHFQLNGLQSRRDLTIRFPDGQRAELPAGHKWVFDDMSANQPFFVQLAGEFMLSRQGLYGIDQRSLRWLGKDLVARPREAYRAEDILRFLRKLFAAYGGKPDVIVFERGVWHSRKIRGHKFTETGACVDDEFDRPEMAAEERRNIADGLQAIGIEVIFATSAHGKIIETCFNHLQTVLGYYAREYVNIGRHAGEFETGAKRLRQVRAGSHTAGNLGFASMTQLSDCIDQAFAHINGRLNSREEVPDKIWERDLAQRPLLPLAADDNFVFLPELRPTKINGGRVTVEVGGRPYDFRADWMAELGGGYRVFVKFDPMNLALGAAILNRELPTNPKNRRLPEARENQPNTGLYGMGDLIGYAAWEIPAPSLDVTGPVRGVEPRPLEEFYPDAIDQGDTLRRKQSKMVATMFSAAPRPGQPAIKTVETSDGLGNVTRVEKGERTEVQGPKSKVQSPMVRVKRTQAVGAEMDDFERQAAQLEKDEQRRQQRLSEQPQFAEEP